MTKTEKTVCVVGPVLAGVLGFWGISALWALMVSL